MSATLPVVQPNPTLLDQLLQEQQQLTAVEEFSQWHQDDAGHGAPAQEQYYRQLLPATPPGPGQQLAFEVDLDACSGCKACVVACHTMNGLEEDEAWRKVGTLVIGDEDPATQDPATPPIDSQQSGIAAIQHVTTACHHCEDPGCLNGCPVKAYEKDPITGIVRHLDDQCIGCKYCTMMCPYEVPQYSDRLGIVRKCDMCHQRLAVGEAPACVQSCPNEAIKIRIVPTGLTLDSPELSTLVPSAPASQITSPTTRYVAEQPIDPRLARPQDDRMDEVAESHWPLALMLVATQVGVGVLVCESLVAGVAAIGGVAIPATVTLIAAVLGFAISHVGLGIAPMHLGQPLRMWRVFLGLRTSWLSREAVVLGKFVGILALGIGLYALPELENYLDDGLPSWLPVDAIPSWLGRAALLGAIVIGLAGLYCSAMIYIATQRQLWRPARTLPRFFGTMVIGGAMVSASLMAFAGFSAAASWLAVLGVVCLIVKLICEARLFGETAVDGDTYDQRSRNLIHKRLVKSLRLRNWLAYVSMVFAVVGAFTVLLLAGFGAGLLAIAAASLIFSECLERILYFQSVVHDRMPGTL
ncbi:MAG: molybdopterin oxidoreductase [Rhodopirellula sp. TMED11]|nr:MAG: molybdopterin oxidoreductase [Rhodopirellula sp. TMED11]